VKKGKFKVFVTHATKEIAPFFFKFLEVYGTERKQSRSGRLNLSKQSPLTIKTKGCVGPGEKNYLNPVVIETEFLDCPARSLVIVSANRGSIKVLILLIT